MDIDSIIFAHGEDREKYFNAVAPPIIQSSNFVFDSIADFKKAIVEEDTHHVYSRGNNPTVDILRKKIAALENTEDALVLGSGASAISATLLSLLQNGDHIICIQKPYSWTYKLVQSILPQYGIDITFVEASDPQNIADSIRSSTKLLFLESPNSITFEIQDLEACSALCRRHAIISVIDNSHASPVFQNPTQWGIDIVIHSATKYLNGHSDVVCGVICSSHVLIKRIFYHAYMTFGQIISPHDAFLVLRGMRTLVLRVHRSDETAMYIVERLLGHPLIADILHPLSKHFAQYDLAQKQMTGNGGLFTIRLNLDDKKHVHSFISSIRHFKIAVSWGGYESLMMPSIAFHDLPGKKNPPIHWTHIRFYAGIEDKDFLLNDILQALENIDINI